MEMITAKQDQAFIDSITNSRMLENTISWVSGNMSPEDVFSKPDLETGAVENGYVISEQP